MCVYITYMCRLCDNSLTQVSGAHYQQQIITCGANVSGLHRHSRWYRANNFRRCVQTFRKFTCYENVPFIYKYFWFERLRIHPNVYWKMILSETYSPIKSIGLHHREINCTIRSCLRKKNEYFAFINFIYQIYNILSKIVNLNIIYILIYKILNVSG